MTNRFVLLVALLAAADTTALKAQMPAQIVRNFLDDVRSGKDPDSAVEIASVVYRVSDSRIVEYWLQTGRRGFDIQLQRHAE